MHALTLPRLGQTMMAGRIVEWFIEEGTAYAEGKVIYSIETDKSILDVEATLPGVLVRKLAEADEEVPVGQLVAVAADPDEAVDDAAIDRFIASRPAVATETDADETVSESVTADAEPAPAAKSAPRAMPRAKRLARELGIDLAEITDPSGADGMITEKDVQRVSEQRAASAAPSAAPATGGRRALSAVEQSIARHMTRCWQVPQFCQDIEIDAEPLLARRRRLIAEGQEVSFTALLLDALVQAALAVPRCNATFDNGELIESAQVDAGVAAATPNGLLVPVLRDCGAQDFATRNARLAALLARAQAGTLTPEELSGGTVTLSNLGASRVESGSPIINAPQVCLVFTGAIVDKPVVRGGSVVPGKRMHVVSVYDHRVVDGVTGARFMDAFATALSAS